MPRLPSCCRVLGGCKCGCSPRWAIRTNSGPYFKICITYQLQMHEGSKDSVYIYIFGYAPLTLQRLPLCIMN